MLLNKYLYHRYLFQHKLPMAEPNNNKCCILFSKRKHDKVLNILCPQCQKELANSQIKVSCAICGETYCSMECSNADLSKHKCKS